MKYILVVCTANICRSPLAEGLIRFRLDQEGLSSEIGVFSAGVAAINGKRADPYVVSLLAERGIAMGLHLSYPLTAREIEEADVILVMEESHRRQILHLASTELHKVLLLSELTGHAKDIADPYMRDIGAYRNAFHEIEQCIALGWPQLLNMLRSPHRSATPN